jgi:transaldolase
MATNFLDQLKAFTTVVSDTGDIHAIEEFTPRDSTTNPSLITTAAEMPEYAAIVDGALTSSKREAGAKADTKAIVGLAIDRLSVDFGLKILGIIPGRVSTEVDARLSFDTQASVAKARKLVGMYEAAGASRERVLIKVAASWEGIRAAELLEREGIHCNLTLLFGLHQAIACAEAKVTLISPFVGRILDWHKAHSGKSSYAPSEDPGVVSVTTIYNYFKHFGYNTEIMGASFRNMGEIVELAGCDLLTIAPKFLAELSKTTGTLERKLDPLAARGMNITKIAMDEAIFRRMHEEDRMSNDKLVEGVDGFSKSLVHLEQVLAARLAHVA